MLVPVRFIQWFWTATTHIIGMRHMGNVVKRSLSAYKDTVFYWEGTGVKGYVALSIDDGLCRQQDNSMVKEVNNLLRSYNAQATFFVCSDYTTSVAEVDSLLKDNHNEFGNHLEKDIMSYYNTLNKEEFRRILQETNAHIFEKLSSPSNQQQGVSPTPIKWFRSPNGRMTKLMCDVVREEGMIHVLGDCYCDDWAFAEAGNVKPVAPLMLKQVHPSGGSIAVFHMPEKGFREASLEALKEFLEGMRERNLQCITLSEMERKSSSTSTESNINNKES